MREVKIRHGIHGRQHGIEIIFIIRGGIINIIVILRVDINVRKFATCHQYIELVNTRICISLLSFSGNTLGPDKIVTEFEHSITTRVSNYQLYLISQFNDEIVQTFH